MKTTVLLILDQFVNAVEWEVMTIISTIVQIKKSKMRSFQSNENIYKKEDVSYHVVSANKPSPVAL